MITLYQETPYVSLLMTLTTAIGLYEQYALVSFSYLVSSSFSIFSSISLISLAFNKRSSKLLSKRFHKRCQQISK